MMNLVKEICIKKALIVMKVDEKKIYIVINIEI